MSACYRLKANYQWVQNHCGHTMIRPQLKRNAPLARVRGNYITPWYVFDKNYIVNIPGKDDWQNQIVHVPEDIVCYTDSSRLQSLSQAGASVHNRTTGLDQIMLKYCTVFKAEVYAILTCANSLQSEQDASILLRQNLHWSEWVSSFLTAHQHIIGYLVPYSGEKVIKMWRYNQGYLATINVK